MDQLLEIALAHDPVLGVVILGLLAAVVAVWKRMTVHELRAIKASDGESRAKDHLLAQAKEQGALMRDVESAIVTMTADRESRILHQARVEGLMSDIKENK